MARTPSNMVSLGTTAPDFSLFDVVSEESKNLNELKGKNGSVDNVYLQPLPIC